MKRHLLLLLLFCFPATFFAQNSGYEKGREIMKDLDSIVSPNGIQENFKVSIGGIEQWVYVRGQHKDNPIILFVHGGPASPMAPVAWTFQRPLEEYFTVIHYDQRGAGRTFTSNDTIGLGKTIRIDQYVNDAVDIARFLTKKYHKKKVILMGHSWGTVVGMKAALQQPDLFYAYIGIGQVINTRVNEKLSFDFALKEAARSKNDAALAELQSIAPYPGDQPITRDRIIIARKWPQFYGGLTAFRNASTQYFYAPLLSPEYSEKDTNGIDSGSLFTLEKILPEFLTVDLSHIRKFPIPVFMFMGRHDYTTPSEPTDLWLKNVKAPIKKGIWFENSAHLIPLEEPGKMLVILLADVRPLAK